MKARLDVPCSASKFLIRMEARRRSLFVTVHEGYHNKCLAISIYRYMSSLSGMANAFTRLNPGRFHAWPLTH